MSTSKIDETKEELLKLAKRCGFLSITKPNAIEEIFKMDETALANLSVAKASEYMIVLSKYGIFLRYQLNGAKVKEIRMKKAYTQMLEEQAFEQEAKTAKERKALAIKNCPELAKLQNEYEAAEVTKTFLEGMEKEAENFCNCLKAIYKDKFGEKKQSWGD